MGRFGSKLMMGLGSKKGLTVQRIANLRDEVCAGLGGHNVIAEDGSKACIRLINNKGTPVEDAVVENLGPGHIQIIRPGQPLQKAKVPQKVSPESE